MIPPSAARTALSCPLTLDQMSRPFAGRLRKTCVELDTVRTSEACQARLLNSGTAARERASCLEGRAVPGGHCVE